ncbi:MAG TPA: hypothetical protein VFS21_19815 [Roseiflexaceae bacterium]|nr:hypothetical protein [Roseiflexaceae bacterium]
MLAIVRLAAAPAGQNAAASVTLALLPDGGVVIADDGRGLPVEPLRPWPEAQRATAALAAPLIVETGRDGGWSRVACVRGAVVKPLRPAISPQMRGTRIGFRPDPALFAAHRFNPARLAAGLAAIRAAVPGVDVRLVRV